MITLRMRQRAIQIGIGLAVVGALALAVVLFVRERDAHANDTTANREDEPALVDVSVTTVMPRQDETLQMTVERPADVEAYFRVEIGAKVAGEVKAITVAPGSAVEKNQTLVQLVVPDLEADEKEKNDIIRQREREEQAGEAKAEAARKAVDTAQANVKVEKTLRDIASATTAYRQVQYKRLSDLLTTNSVEAIAVDEAKKQLAVAVAGEAAAEAAREKAEAQVEDARANVKVMEAEVERMKQLIAVAKSAHEIAQARLDFANVKAPFQGTVVSRHVHPGSFVQNASTGRPTPVLTLERTDIVTVVMRVPDNYASFVTPGTEAILELNKLPGVKIRGKVTRMSKSLTTDTRDRTMRVEVDLWNRNPADYAAFFADPKNRKDLKEGPLPLIPEFVGKDPLGRSTRLMADDYGKMTLILKTFDKTYLIPSQAIIRRGGRTSIYVCADGKAKLLTVEVLVDDGNLAKVERLGELGEVLGDLTGKEEVIVSNQEELTEGQPVKTALQTDWSTLNPGKKTLQ